MDKGNGFSKMWYLVLLLVTFVAGCAGNAAESAKAVTAYSLAGVAGTINEPAKTVSLTLPYGTALTALVATFTTTGTSIKVGTVPQTSTVTANNYTAPLSCTVTGADGSTATYSVIVTIAPNSAKALTAYAFVGLTGAAAIINEPAKTIAATVPFGTDVTNLVATFTTTGAGVTVGAVAQTSGTTDNDFTGPVTYRITAADNSTASYTVNVTIAPNPAKALTAYAFVGFTAFPGTINEPAKTIAVTVPFGTNVTQLVATFTTTGAGVTIGGAVQTSAATTNDFTVPVAYLVTAADNSTATYTVTVTLAPNPAKAITAYAFVGFTGFAGTINEAAKTIAVTVPFGTDVTNLVATFTTTGTGVKVGSAVQTSTATANNFTVPVAYLVTAADGTTVSYTVTVALAPNPAKAITAYSFVGFPGVAGTINEAAKTIAVTVPFGTDVTNLVASFTTTGTGVTIGIVAQTSGITANNFTMPVTYTVTAADLSTSNYNVTVSLATTRGPSPVNLGTAGNFVILAKTGVSSTGSTAVVGDIGLSPAAASFITGFSLIPDSTNTFATSFLVTGKLYASDYATPTPAVMTAAISDMQTAYSDAAGRTTPDFTELGAGDISGLTLVPGLYKWGTGVLLTNTGVTLSGGANDVWIFQVAGDLTVNNSAIVTLVGGAQAKNVFWQVAGKATLGTAAGFKGIILSQTLISLDTGATMNGRALAQTAVTLNATAITAP